MKRLLKPLKNVLEKKMSRYFRSYLNRTACDVLTDMRACCKTLNFAAFPGLIEELQSMANRMESALSDNKDWEQARSELKKLEAEVKALEDKKEQLESKVEDK